MNWDLLRFLFPDHFAPKLEWRAKPRRRLIPRLRKAGARVSICDSCREGRHLRCNSPECPCIHKDGDGVMSAAATNRPTIGPEAVYA